MDKESFVMHAIADSQAAIRGVDVKLGFMFIVLISPSAKLDEIVALTVEHLGPGKPFLTFFCIASLICWLLAVGALFASIKSYPKPFLTINPGGATGMFYDLTVFKDTHGTIDISKTEFSIHRANVLKELVYELAKVQRIRNNKTNWLNLCIIFTLLVMSFGLLAMAAYVLEPVLP